MANILVVDDELGIRDLLSEILNDEGHTVELAENAAQAREARQRMRPDLVLLDIWMPDTDGVTLLKEWSTGGLLNMPVIMMSGHATIDTAVDAIRIGAQAFLEKPITLQKLLWVGVLPRHCCCQDFSLIENCGKTSSDRCSVRVGTHTGRQFLCCGIKRFPKGSCFAQRLECARILFGTGHTQRWIAVYQTVNDAIEIFTRRRQF